MASRGLAGRAAVAGFACALAGPAAADMLSASYRISLAGFSIGQADIGANIAGGRYRIEAAARMTGLAGVVTRGSAHASASGVVGQRAPISDGYSVTAMGSDGPRSVRVAMASGTVRSAEMNPPLDHRPDRIPVTESHKRNVLDPVSALMAPMGQGPRGALDPAGCNRTLPVFDGAARFDVVLSYKDTRAVGATGYSGPALVCAARYVPHAGHRPGRKAIQFMADNRDMEVWLAPVGETRVLMPYRISVRTMIGTTVVEAARFAVEPASGPAAQRAQR